MPLLRTVATLATLGMLLLAVPDAACARTVGKDGGPIVNSAGVTFGVTAHRGGAAEWPENSLAAFTADVEAGFDAIETDLVFTKDAQGVMSHSDRLPRRCTHAGTYLHTLTLAQVRRIRCANLAGSKVVPIPTFDQLAAVLAQHPEVDLHLEVKTYTGQSASGMRLWARRAVQLLIAHDLLEQSSMVTFNWPSVMSTILASAPGMKVHALDHGPSDPARVRLAARLGVHAYGTRMKYTSMYLAEYVRSLGMESQPWGVMTEEERAFTIHYSGPEHFFGTDTPTALQASLVAGRVDLDPDATIVTTQLANPVRISDTRYVAGVPQDKQVGRSAVPSAAIPMLAGVILEVTVAPGGSGGEFEAAPTGATTATVRVALDQGPRSFTVKVPLGKDRRVRIRTTRTARLTVRVTGYERMRLG